MAAQFDKIGEKKNKMRDFINAMIAEGLGPKKPSQIEETFGKFKRYQTTEDKPNKPSGYYRLTIKPDGFAVGCFGSHRFGVTHTWFNKPTKSFLAKNNIDMDTIRQRQEQERKAQERERRMQAQAAANKARAVFRSLGKAPAEHEYFKAKGVRPEGDLRVDKDGNVVVPVWVGKKRSSLQTITPDGDKKFLKGGEIKGGFFPIIKEDDNKTVFVICEGLATGLTIREACDVPVVVAFNANNLRPVVEDMRGRYPAAKIIVAADNDQWRLSPKAIRDKKVKPDDKPSEGDDGLWADWREAGFLENIGLDKAREAAASVGGFCMVPPIPDDEPTMITDFNDIGVMATKDTFDRVMAESRLPDAMPERGEKSGNAVVAQKEWRDMLAWKDRDKNLLEPSRALHNGIKILAHSDRFNGCFAWNDFEHDIFIVKPLPWEKSGSKYEPRRIEEQDLVRIQADLQFIGASLTKSGTGDALHIASREQTFHPVKDYFLSLKWDGKERLETWLIDYANAVSQDESYVRTVGKYWLMAAVKRILEPGAPFHHMLVLEGKQGMKKSSLFEELATVYGHKFFQNKLNFNNMNTREGIEGLQGVLIAEFQELDGLTQSAIKKVKGWIQLSEDEVRKLYQNQITTLKRQFVLAGTTNETEWLTDPTGGRRFWPVKSSGVLDVEGLGMVKDQLWAEALHYVKRGDRYWVEPTDEVHKLFVSEQEERRDKDPWEAPIRKYMSEKGSAPIDDILTQALHIDKGRQDKAQSSRVRDIMQSMGYINKPAHCAIRGRVIRKFVKDD